jgi:peptidoglycan/xylan/chitin deacetylase (PgdA/CDA1 family)
VNKGLEQALAFLFRSGPCTGIVVGNHTQNRDQIRQEIEVLGRFFEFIHHDQLADRMKKKGRRPFCLLTFDDGKKINALETAPQLAELGVPAVFYLVTDAVTTGRALWFDLRNVLLRAPLTDEEKQKIAQLKTLSMDRVGALLDALAKKYQAAPDMSDPCVAPMSWDDAAVLHEKGFTIGAHTCSHPVLTRETRESACREIRDSIAQVSERIGTRCASFAFPNGSYTDDLASYAQGCGVSSVMTTDPVWARPETELWRLPRIDIYTRYTPWKTLVKVAAAKPGYVLKNPNGTGRAYVTGRKTGFSQSRRPDSG